MRKIVSVVLLSLVGMWGVAQADDDTGGTAAPMLSQEMVGHINSLEGSAVNEMYKSAWQCFLDARLVMLGAGLKSKGGDYEGMLASQGFSDRTRGIVEDGFKYSDPLDKGISDIFATCLHSAHEDLSQ